MSLTDRMAAVLRTFYFTVIAPMAIALALAGLVAVPAVTAYFYPGRIIPQVLSLIASIALFICTIAGVQRIARSWSK